MLRMFALIMPKPVCVCVRSRAVNPAYIPGPDINTVLESRGARLAVMLEESSLCSSLSASYERRGRVGRSGHAHRLLDLLWYSAVLDQCSCQTGTHTKKRKDKPVCVYVVIITKHSLLFFFVFCWQDL